MVMLLKWRSSSWLTKLYFSMHLLWGVIPLRRVHFFVLTQKFSQKNCTKVDFVVYYKGYSM